MEYTESFLEAIKKNELISFLRGDASYRIEVSQYTQGAEPTDVGKVLSRVIYKYYSENPIIKEEFENALMEMVKGTSFDVYVVTLYMMSQLFKEKNGLSPFIMDTKKIVLKLQVALKNNKEALMLGVKYPDGFEKKEVWNEIERFDKVCQQEYKVALLI